MPIIASHHKSDIWRPCLGWPDDARVQWGGRGIVLGRPGTTAFFEVFPSDGSGGFIRGEGETVESAEADAFRLWQKQHACFLAGGHLWTRTPRRTYQRGKPLGTYTNGGCFCLRCGSFESVMTAIQKLGDWRKPLDAMVLDGLAMGYNRPLAHETAKDALYKRQCYLRAAVQGLRMPAPVPATPGNNPFNADAYVLACRRAVKEWLVGRFSTLQEPGKESVEDFFSSMSMRSLKHLLDDDETTPQATTGT